MTKARQLADLGNVYDDGALSNRNLIINGAMQVAQRGTTNGPNATNGVLALDRWYVNASGGTKTISQEEFTVGQTDVPDFPKYYMRLAVSTADNNLGVHQKVEDVTVLGGKTVTLSFWAKGTNPAGGSFVSSWIQNFGSGGSTLVETEAKSGIVLTSTWQKFTITFDVPSVSGKTIGTSSYTWVELLRQPGTDTGTSGWTADIAQVQLEVGDTATPFEHRSYGDELQRCQRYYESRAFPVSQYIAVAFAYNTTQGRFNLGYTQKRTTPSISFSGSTRAYYNSTSHDAITLTAEAQGATSSRINYTLSSATQPVGNAVGILSDSGTFKLQVDAEL